ncbi:uncharacterized protein LOC119788237 isoform X2 [Cyprinodon tularosa]|uniref:uncharacterized protein LOC119788237 isoform X2 n=1 Tax=Cyprinodon tularosa TaxID=77115 RepID=UPI0018E25B36|nr:uncharacterized protein LOC119788237 isoform X2 [Cyprinodon tularosa]
MSDLLREGFSGSSPTDLRLVLLGNIGCGKTSTADTILGQLSPVSPSAARSSTLRQGLTEGRRVTLVEAPRWFWIGCDMDEGVKKETQRGMSLVAPGPHAVLLLVPVNQFTEMEGRVPAELEKLFGTEVLDHTLVLLTCGDYLMGKTVEQYLQREHPGLRQVIERCGGRYHVFNNRQRQDKEQVQELLKKVDSMVQTNGVYCIKTDQEKELEKRVLERKRELMESFRAQKEEEKKLIMAKSVSDTDVFDARQEPNSTLERRRKYKDEIEGRVVANEVSNGLYSAPATERPSYSEPKDDDSQLTRTPSFRLNADGALLSQISETQSKPKLISTYHHRINSFEENSPGTSPTFSPHSPTFSPHSPTFSPHSPTVSPHSPTFSPHSPTFSPSSYSTQTFAASPTPVPRSSSSPPSSPSQLSTPPELRLILLGRSGVGKSAAGNSILGQELFESHPDSFTAITQKCEKKKAMVEGKRVSVVDTPDWFNSEQTPDEVRAQISSCVALSSPGPHAFLLCVPLDQPAKTELQALEALGTVFGPEAVQKHTMVLFTYADKLRESGKVEGKSVENYIASQRGDLVKLVEKCRDRYHVMEKGDGWRQKQNVAELLEKVQQTVKEAGGQCYSTPAFQEAEEKVRQRQLEIAAGRRGIKPELAVDDGQLSSMRQTLAPINEEITEEEIVNTRDEAERIVSSANIESLPPVTLSTMSPSLLRSMMEKVESGAKMLPQLLANSSTWVEDSAKQVKGSPVWEKIGSGAQNVQKMVADSPMWEKVGTTAGQVSQAVGKRVPQKVVDGSAWVGSGAKAVTSSPMWGKVGSGAKNLAKSPVWGKVGSGAKTGAKLMADGSVKVGEGIGAGAKKVAQSPVWEKVGAGVKAGAKRVSESSVWEKMGNTAKQVPKTIIIGAILGLVLGVILAGLIGGAVGTGAGAAVSEVVRRKFSNKSTSDGTINAEVLANNSTDGRKLMKTE